MGILWLTLRVNHVRKMVFLIHREKKNSPFAVDQTFIACDS
uniref:Uncharacterized protein n=1 Tax=Rhizophora mucronata TaxID=61149 RepID=A0A2P2QJA3_RHIMU